MSTLRVNEISARTGSGDIQVVGGKIVSPGSVLQVVSATKTDVFTSSSVAYVGIPGLSVSLTPKATTSRVLVTVHLNGAASNVAVGIVVRRNGTDIVVGDLVAGITNRVMINAYNGGDDANSQTVKSMSFFDSPNSTAELTYQVFVGMIQGVGVFVLNENTSQVRNQTYSCIGVSTLNAMEIAQ